MLDCHYRRTPNVKPKLNLSPNKSGTQLHNNSFDKRTCDNNMSTSFNQQNSVKVKEPTVNKNEDTEVSTSFVETSLPKNGNIELRDAKTLSKTGSRIDSVYMLPKVKFVNLNGTEIPVLDENLFKVPSCQVARLPSVKTESKILTEV